MESLNLDLAAEELREVDLDLDLSNDVSAINISSNNDIKNIDLGSVSKPRPNLMVHDSNSNIGLDLLVNKSKLSKDDNAKPIENFNLSGVLDSNNTPSTIPTMAPVLSDLQWLSSTSWMVAPVGTYGPLGLISVIWQVSTTFAPSGMLKS